MNTVKAIYLSAFFRILIHCEILEAFYLLIKPNPIVLAFDFYANDIAVPTSKNVYLGLLAFCIILEQRLNVMKTTAELICSSF